MVCGGVCASGGVLSGAVFLGLVQQVELGLLCVEGDLELGEPAGILIDVGIAVLLPGSVEVVFKGGNHLLDLLERIRVESLGLFEGSGPFFLCGAGRPAFRYRSS